MNDLAGTVFTVVEVKEELLRDFEDTYISLVKTGSPAVESVMGVKYVVMPDDVIGTVVVDTTGTVVMDGLVGRGGGGTIEFDPHMVGEEYLQSSLRSFNRSHLRSISVKQRTSGPPEACYLQAQLYGNFTSKIDHTYIKICYFICIVFI